MEHQMESLKLGLTTISDRLGTIDIQLIPNFPNTSGKQVTTKFSIRLNEILLHMPRLTSVVLGDFIYASKKG